MILNSPFSEYLYLLFDDGDSIGIDCKSTVHIVEELKANHLHSSRVQH
jgi:hypothetical protein